MLTWIIVSSGFIGRCLELQFFDNDLEGLALFLGACKN